GYVVSGVTAGLTAGVYDKWTSTQTGTSTALPNTGAVATTSPLSTWQGVGQFTANQVLQNGTSVLVDRALGGEARLGDALQNSLANAFAAYGFNLVGDVSKGRFTEGGITKIGLHALMGGLAAEASGGDFRTGVLAAGVTEALVDSLAKNYADMPDDQKKGLLVMNSQLIGVLAASVLDGADAKSLQTGAWVAGTATQYNYLNHPEVDDLVKDLKGCRGAGDPDACRSKVTAKYEGFSDTKTGRQMLACEDYSSCNALRTDVEGGTKALDTYDVSGDLNPKEKEIVQGFIDKNQDDLRLTVQKTTQATNAEVAGIVLSGGLGAGAKVVAESAGAKSALNKSLLDELSAKGVKFTPENVVATARSPSGQVLFLETGNSKAGLQHIIEEHGSQFAQMGVSNAQIPGAVMKAVSEGKLVGYQGTGAGRPIYELTVNGQTQHIAVTVGGNGFIVGANPRGSVK
ncbi:filamentous hemagglutinin, partial [Pseudomonas salomonii]